MLWAGLAGVGWPAAEQRLEAKFDVALFQDALDCPLAQLAGQGEDGCDCVPQMAVAFLHPVELARLIRGRSLGSPAADLLRVDVHEFQLLSMNPVVRRVTGARCPSGPGTRSDGREYDLAGRAGLRLQC